MAHARLSASGAHRWLECPGSVKLEDLYDNVSSTYAAEGTYAHELAEYMLKNKTRELPAYADKSQYYSTELVEYVNKHVDLVEAEYNQLKRDDKNTQLIVESVVEFSDVVPEGFGTADILIISDKVLKVIDLKYGKGVQVDANNNYQLRLYAYGALKGYGFLNDFEAVEMIISQPRLDWVSGEVISPEELTKWAKEYVKPRAKEAYEGVEIFNPGEKQCRFCKARQSCKARATHMIELVNKYHFDDARLLSKDDIEYILDNAQEIEKWITDIKEYAFNAINDGEDIPGYKLVEGRSTRKIKDPINAANVLRLAGYSDDDFIESKLVGITKLEKLLGKKEFENLLGNEIIKPEGKPVLAKEDDKRPSITKKSVDDFKNINFE